MNYKITGSIERNKNRLIVFAVLWLFMTIVLVVPVAYAQNRATIDGQLNFSEFFNQIISAYSNFGSVLGSFGSYIADFFALLGKFTIVFIILMIIGLFKTAPKNEYTNIEQGSSDWATGGEQYRVLSKNKGIVLAENNYLPLDKRGNINVLVVGRFRFW